MYLQNDDGLWGICPEGLRTYQGARRSASPRLQVSTDMVPGAARSILSNKLYTTGYTA